MVEDKPGILDRSRPFLGRDRAKVPRGLRFFLGGLLIISGLLGFLPILGFWMIPLGIAVAAIDVQLYRHWRRKQRFYRGK